MKHPRDKESYVERRLAQLAEEYELTPEAVERLRVLLRLLEEDVAPTTVRDPRRGVDIHLADSLSGLHVEALRTASTVADLGSGAGLPALALAAARPGTARVVAVESVARKGDFIRRAAAEMGLEDVEVVIARAEEWSEGLGQCGVVTARALAAMPVILEYAAPLLSLGGTVIAWKGQVSEEEDADGLAAAATLGLERGHIRKVGPFPGADERYLHVYSKVMETPPNYPRRAGIATKRPLSAKK